MAVAERFARCWPRRGAADNSDASPPELHFEGFDLDTCGLAAFRACDADFAKAGSNERSITAVFNDGGSLAASILHRLLVGSEDAPATSEVDCPLQGARVMASETVQHPLVDEVIVGGPSRKESIDDDADSDDDDPDNPLNGLAPLPSLKAPPDACEDLRLVARPRSLQGAYEMLLGPAKTDNARDALVQPMDASSLSAADDPSRPAVQEPPATARARVAAALAALPELLRAAPAPADLPRLGEALCARLLHMGGDTLVAEEAVGQRRASLAALLAADGSRRATARALIVEFASEDMTLAARLLILDALSDAARILSNRAGSAGGEIAPRSPRPPLGDVPGASKTRRFASATRIPPSQPNRFAGELRHFLLPLLARFQRPDKGAASWAVREPLLVGPLLQCLGVLLECGGPACADRDLAAASCLDLVEAFWRHGEPYVRRCSLFLLSRALLVGAEDVVMMREELVEQLEPAMMYEGDDACRKMIAGILSWLQRAVLALTTPGYAM